MPTGVSAAVSEARDVSDEDLVRAERVAIGASRRRMGDPLPGRRLHQLAIAWVLRDARVTSALIGASSVEHLEANLKAATRRGHQQLTENDR